MICNCDCSICSLPDILPKLDPNLVRIIQSIGHADSIKARAAINELNDILESSEKQAILRDYEELYIESICSQFKVISDKIEITTIGIISRMH